MACRIKSSIAPIMAHKAVSGLLTSFSLAVCSSLSGLSVPQADQALPYFGGLVYVLPSFVTHYPHSGYFLVTLQLPAEICPSQRSLPSLSPHLNEDSSGLMLSSHPVLFILGTYMLCDILLICTSYLCTHIHTNVYVYTHM